MHLRIHPIPFDRFLVHALFSALLFMAICLLVFAVFVGITSEGKVVASLFIGFAAYNLLFVPILVFVFVAFIPTTRYLAYPVYCHLFCFLPTQLSINYWLSAGIGFLLANTIGTALWCMFFYGFIGEFEPDILAYSVMVMAVAPFPFICLTFWAVAPKQEHDGTVGADSRAREN